jgi:hypothetical protein
MLEIQTRIMHFNTRITVSQHLLIKCISHTTFSSQKTSKFTGLATSMLLYSQISHFSQEREKKIKLKQYLKHTCSMQAGE